MKTRDTIDYFYEAIAESAHHGEMLLSERQIFSLAEWALIASEQLAHANALTYHLKEVERLVKDMNGDTEEIMNSLRKAQLRSNKKAKP